MKIKHLYAIIGLLIIVICMPEFRFGQGTVKDGRAIEKPLSPDEEEFVAVAVSDYESTGCDDTHKAIFDHGNKLWYNKLQCLKSEKCQLERLINELNGRNYQVVKLELLPDMLGGDVWYFVDLDTREVITTYGEK